MVLASLSLVSAPTLRAQDSDITIKDPAEFNAYQMATSQTDAKTKASQYETFLQNYPQSVVKKAVLEQLVATYQSLSDADKALSAATRLLQIDPNNMKAYYISVYVKKSQCGKTQDAQTCDDAAALAKKGLLIAKPEGTSDDDWKKLTGIAFPLFHSTIAFSSAVKKDYKSAIAEYTAELMLYSDEETKTAGLQDTLLLAQAYAQAGASQDMVKAIWFYARVWNFVPANYKPTVEKSLNYYYKKYHGDMKGLDDIKTQAAASTFPSGTLVIAQAKTPAEQIHELLESTPDLSKLALADKETILAVGSKEDADKMWAILKDQLTPIPGVVLEATASVLKLAVTQDAKDSKVPDFIVNLKTPLEEKDIPAVGFEFKLQPNTELDGTYDSYTQIPATATTTPAAQIVIRDGFIQAEAKKKAAAPAATAKKPAAGHKK
jgi:tetratricopeptide (TPR) repeat protein